MSYQEKDVDIFEIFEEVTKSHPEQPNHFPLKFELGSLKALFEFLLQFVTMLCTKKYGNDTGHVNLAAMNPSEFEMVNKYMQSIGFNCNFNICPANAHYINHCYDNRFDRVSITNITKLSDLIFGIKCDETLYIISFSRLAM